VFWRKGKMALQKLKIIIDKKPNYLQVYTCGMRSRENVKNISIKVFNTAIQHKLHNILIDVRELIGDFGYSDIYFLVKEVLKDYRGKGVEKVAVIDVHRTTRPDWFLEPVAHSYGLNIRVFPEEEPALAWLNE
jgi:hypothetical protein